MKLKELCEITGLTRKTIRLYEEKGLFTPSTVRLNGRTYREYSPEDVQKLNTIATLRKAWFTMDEIARMQDNPEEIQVILPQYHQWLKQQKEDLEELLSIADQLNVESIHSIEGLKDAMGEVANKLPLPELDIKPRFQYLDEIEQRPKEVHYADYLDKVLPVSKGYRTFVATTSRDKSDNLLITASLINETKDLLQNGESVPVSDNKSYKTPWWNHLLTGFLILTLLFAVVSTDLFPQFTFAKPLFYIAIGLKVLGIIVDHFLREKKWLNAVGAKKGRLWERIEWQKLKIPGIILAIVIILGGFLALILPGIRSSTEPDCTIVYIAELPLSSYNIELYKTRMQQLISDQNGDGYSRYDFVYYPSVDDISGSEMGELYDENIVFFVEKEYIKEFTEKFPILEEDILTTNNGAALMINSPKFSESYEYNKQMLGLFQRYIFHILS